MEKSEDQSEIVDLLFKKYSLLRQEALTHVGYFKGHVAKFQLVGSALLAGGAYFLSRPGGLSLQDWWVWWLGATAVPIMCHYLIFDIIESQYALVLLNERLATLEEEVNKRVGTRILIWESSVVPRFWQGFRPMPGVINPDWLLSFFGSSIMFIEAALIPSLLYYFLWESQHPASLGKRVAIFAGVAFTVLSMSASFYCGWRVLLRMRGKPRVLFREFISQPLRLDPLVEVKEARMGATDTQTDGLGEDPDPEGEVEKRIKVGWALVGVFFTLGIFTFLLQSFGLAILPSPQSRTIADYARLFAFCVSCLNIGIWMWFPLQDVAVLRRWVRTRGKIFPANTAEFFAILLAMILLLLLTVGALSGPLWFGIAGTAVVIWDAVGYSLVHRHVIEAVREARSLYSEDGSPAERLRLQALDQIEIHWSCRSTGWTSDWRQIRLVTLALCFATVTILAALGEAERSVPLKFAAYMMGAATLIFAEIWIARQRISRDNALVKIREEMRRTSQRP